MVQSILETHYIKLLPLAMDGMISNVGCKREGKSGRSTAQAVWASMINAYVQILNFKEWNERKLTSDVQPSTTLSLT